MKMVSVDDTLSVKEEFHTENAEEDSASARWKLLMRSPGPTSRRIQLNPLKHLAHLLRQRLMAAHGAPCNMLQVALELHSRAQEKKSTTLRRIYDVVNVCEGAGVLARTGPKGNTASDLTLLQRYFPFRRTGKRTLREGSTIQWVGGENSESPCKNQKHLLEVEKGHTADRILQKRRLCDTLSKQVAILQRLLEENQENSESSGGHGDIFSELPSLHSLEGYSNMDYLMCDSFVDQQRPLIPKRLHLPFVMLATHMDANVDICMTGSAPPYQVHLQLDQSYCLIDHIQMIKMLPERRTGKHPQLQSEPWKPERSVT